MLGQLAKPTDAQWQRTVCHATWGEPTLEWLMNRCAEHQLGHLAHIESVRAQLAAFLAALAPAHAFGGDDGAE
jgi:hypothetical protein